MADQRPIGFWLQLVDRLIEERFSTALEEHGVTRRQWWLLNILSRGTAAEADLNAELPPVFPAAADGSDPETVREHLGELVESGWVVESTSHFSITVAGRTAFDALAAVIETIRRSTTDGISPEEYEQTLATLERMARNLDWDAGR